MDELMDCPVCHHSVVSTSFSFRYDMCCYCVDDIEHEGQQIAYDYKRTLETELEDDLLSSYAGG